MIEREPKPLQHTAAEDQDQWRRLAAAAPLIEFLPAIDRDPKRNQFLVGTAREYAYDSIDSSPFEAEKQNIMFMAEALSAGEHPVLGYALKRRAYSLLEGHELAGAMTDRTAGTSFHLMKYGSLESALAVGGEDLMQAGFPQEASALLILALTIYHFQHYRGANVLDLMAHDLKNLAKAYLMLDGEYYRQRAAEFAYRAVCLEGRGLPTLP